ncbi:MAG: Protein YceI [Candidatus Moanabacter tarae]|uniref:Protein YceI n=1 Tax=Candidatus Moanibacter tarae TaxID=2200854 RepID=A0A2Z4AFZ4_9BACT|nr:MAG: Protein YceI [Candidatus Moanabacter tarae]|tara:strand:+ start:2280 stop:2870 length:591 start_codon:yes stop_codon:yes gene_type:complete
MRSKCITSLIRIFSIAISLCALSQSLRGVEEIYKADPSHSGIGFKVRHFFSSVPGMFTDFEATIIRDTENSENNSIDAVIIVESINTNHAKRDKHLRNEDFFDEPIHPTITFKSTRWEEVKENQFTVTGNLKLLNVTKEIILDVRLTGAGPNHRGVFLTGWEMETTLDRRDFGITYGQDIIGNDVSVEISIEAQKQ